MELGVTLEKRVVSRELPMVDKFKEKIQDYGLVHQQPDLLLWKNSSIGCYTVTEVYISIDHGHSPVDPFLYKLIWKLKMREM